MCWSGEKGPLGHVGPILCLNYKSPIKIHEMTQLYGKETFRLTTQLVKVDGYTNGFHI